MNNLPLFPREMLYRIDTYYNLESSLHIQAKNHLYVTCVETISGRVDFKFIQIIIPGSRVRQ